MAEITYTLKSMNNYADPSNVGAPRKDRRELVFTEGVLLQNLDPASGLGGADADCSASLRQGRGAPFVSTSTAHSGWSNPYNPTEFYYVDGALLKRVTVAGSSLLTTTIRSDLRVGLPMSFVQVNDVVRYGNGVQSGIIENGFDVVPFTPTMNFKKPMVPGHFLEFYNGRLYALQTGFLNDQSALYCSDSLDTPGGIESMDTRFDVLAVFDGPGHMLQRTDTGLYVSAGAETFFFKGDDPWDGKATIMMKGGYSGGLEQISVAPYRAVPGTSRPIKAELLGIEGWRGWAALWTSEQGICAGSSEGVFMNLTQERVSFTASPRGCAAIVQDGGNIYYKVSLQAPGSEFNLFRPLEAIEMVAEEVNQVGLP